MGNYKSKKDKKQESDIKSLAEDILKQSDESDNTDLLDENQKDITPENTEQTNDDVFTPSEIIEPLEETKKSKGKIPTNEKEEKVAPITRVILDKGTTKATAFTIQRHINEMYSILGHYFGNKNGDYFIGSENTLTSNINGVRKRYKCVIVEDKNRFVYSLWFDLTNIGPVY